MEMIAHTIILAVVLGLFMLTEKWIEFIAGAKVFYGIVPLRFIFDTAELVTLIAFFYVGTVEALRAYRGTR
jgi:hypothetical protein